MSCRCLLLLTGVLVLAAAGCDTWKRADARAGQLLAWHVGVVKVDGRSLIRIQSRRSAVLIDQAGGRVVDFHLGRRPHVFYEINPRDEDRPTTRVTAESSGPNVLAPPGWRTTSGPGDEAGHERVYWQVDAALNRVVLLSDAAHGLRWRKTFELDELSGELALTVQLQNTRWWAVEVHPASLISTRGPLIAEESGQRSVEQGQRFTRRLVAGAVAAQPFDFGALKLGALQSLVWEERWSIKPEPPATNPAVFDRSERGHNTE